MNSFADAEAHLKLGNNYIESGKYQEAIEEYKQAIKIEPDFAEAHNNLGLAYDKSGKYQEAIEEYKQAIKVKPNFPGAHNNMGIAYGESGKYQEAIKAFNQALKVKPNFPEAYNNLGFAYYKSAKYQEAIKAYKQALKIQPDDAGAHFYLGLSYSMLNDKDSALKEYNILKNINPEFAKSLVKLIKDKELNSVEIKKDNEYSSMIQSDSDTDRGKVYYDQDLNKYRSVSSFSKKNDNISISSSSPPSLERLRNLAKIVHYKGIEYSGAPSEDIHARCTTYLYNNATDDELVYISPLRMVCLCGASGFSLNRCLRDYFDTDYLKEQEK
jgi:tetratricopeptide (TPR) repeat protein